VLESGKEVNRTPALVFWVSAGSAPPPTLLLSAAHALPCVAAPRWCSAFAGYAAGLVATIVVMNVFQVGASSHSAGQLPTLPFAPAQVLVRRCLPPPLSAPAGWLFAGGCASCIACLCGNPCRIC
jgi:hypothetical protein